MPIPADEWFGPAGDNRVRSTGLPGLPVDEFFAMPQNAAPAVAPQQNQPGAVSSLARGVANIGADLSSSAQLFTSLMQMPEASDYFNRKSEAWKLVAEQFPRAVPRIEDIHSAGDFGTWAWETLWEQVPFIASLAIPGGIAAKGASKIPAVARAGLAAEEALAMGSKAVPLLSKVPKYAGYTAAFLADLGLMTGESVDIAKEAGQPIEDLRVIGSGFGKAILDFIPFWTLAKTTGIAKPFEAAILKKFVEGGYLKRAAGNAAVLIASEVPTETMQEVINNELDNYFTGYDGPITEEQKSRLYNAAAGAAMFGALGLYAPARVPPPSAPDQETLKGDIVSEPLAQPSLLLEKLPPDSYKFSIPNADMTPPEGGFDFRNLYDKKTGELKTTAEDYMRIVQEQTQVKYDPLTDNVAPIPGSAKYTTIIPGWQQRGEGWYLDAPMNNVDAGRAQITQTPEGFAAFDVYGNSLGVYPDLTSAQMGATAAVYAKSSAYLFDNEGMTFIEETDPHQEFVQSVGVPTTPVELAAAEIEKARPKRPANVLRAPLGEAAVSEISLDPQLMSLIEVRNDFVNDKTNYRSTDGEMKKDAAKKLKGIDERIQRFAAMKGKVAPEVDETVSIVGEKIDETLGKVENEAAKKQQEAQYPNLTAFEAKKYSTLVEKEMYDGLGPHDREEFDRLSVKIKTGVDRFGEYEPAPPEVLAEFSAEENALLKKASRHKARYSKATRAIAKMRGIQLSKGGVETPPSFFEGGNWKNLAGTVLEDSIIMDDSTIILLSTEKQAMIGEIRFQDGKKQYHMFKEFKDEMYSLGYANDLSTAVAVAEGASPAFVQEVREGLRPIWETFPLRPRVEVMSTADILNSATMTENEKLNLLSSHGIFIGGKPGVVYVHIDQHMDYGSTVKTLIHEMLAHFGLKATMAQPFYADIMLAYADHYRERIKFVEDRGLSQEAAIVREAGEDRLADIMSADEAIAYYAQEAYTGNPLKPYQQNYLDRVITTFKKWLRWLVSKVPNAQWRREILAAIPFNDKDVTKLLRDVAAAMRKQPQSVIDSTYMKRDFTQSRKGNDELHTSIDSHSSVWTANAAALFLQPLQFAEKYNVPGVAKYIGFVQKWAARKSSLQNAPVKLVERWQNYSKRKANKLAEALLFITGASDEKMNKTGQPLTDPERQAILKQHGVVDAEGLQIYEDIRQSFKELIDYLENAIIRNTIRKEVTDPAYADKLYKAFLNDQKPQSLKDAKQDTFDSLLTKDLKDFDLGKRLMQTKSQMAALRQRDYFPYMRFGRYAIWVRAKEEVVIGGKKYRKPFTDKNGDDHPGQMVHYETYETYKEMKEALKSIESEYLQGPYKGKVEIGTGKVSDQEHTLLGMPPALYETLQEQLGLTEKQKEQLKEIYFTKSPGQRFLRSMVNRKGIRGFSNDAIRVYSSYMLNAAGHIARIEHGQDMDTALTEINKNANTAGINAGTVRDYWAKHYRYIMNPENDWAGLRAVGFLFYLGFNVKSAAVNLTQVPMVAYPYLAARFGDKRAMAALMQSYKTAFKLLRNQDIANPELQAAIDQGIADGFLDESLATVLAGFSETSTLQRLMPESDAQRRLNQVSWAGAFLFRHVEGINRYVTFIAARKLAMETNGKNTELAYAEAKEAVQSAMFEYAKWNRATFARGKKSVFFLFWSYMQGLAYLMAGGKGKQTALRVWVMMLLAAGYQGIPFADNILDLFDWGSRELKEALGLKDPYTDSRTAMRELAQTITDNPDMLLHGWSKHYGLGPLHLLALAGVPVPEVDLSGSLGVGRWLPGTDKMTQIEKDPDKRLGQVMVDVMGPVAGVGYGFYRVLTDNNPDRWKVWERALPSALKGASQAMRRMDRGAEEFRGGGAIAEWDPTNPEDRLSLAFNMLAFQPSKVTTAYEAIGAKENLRRYWTSRQAIVMENYAFALRTQDPEVIADARAAMNEFNETIPDPLLRLTHEKIRRSMKARQQKVKLREMGLPSEKGYRNLYAEIDRIYGLK